MPSRTASSNSTSSRPEEPNKLAPLRLALVKFTPSKIVPDKSTSLKSTSEKLVGDFGLGMNPEFLREGNAVQDFMNPDRIVFGFEDEKTLDILKEMTNLEKTQIICQEFIEDIYEGDHRVLIIHGKPFEKTLARIPQDGSFKGNLAAGGKGIAKDITDFQKKVGQEIGEYLNKSGINFAGIDIIGEYLTEINITSPTCAREILDQTGINPIAEYFKEL